MMLKALLERHSSIWRHFHPVVDPRVVCGGCSGLVFPEANGCAHPHHYIGRVNYQGTGEKLIACDGSEDCLQ